MKIQMELNEHLKSTHNEIIRKYADEPDSFDFDNEDHEDFVYLFADP